MFDRRHLPPARWLGGALRRHGDAVFEYAHFLTGDDTAARALQRAAFLDAHQALLLGGRLRNPRAWLLRAVRDTAGGDRPVAEEHEVLRRICGLRAADAAWVLEDDGDHAKRRIGRRRVRVTAGAGAGAAMAARTSTAKALAVQVPGFTAASATGVTHLIIASAVASSALVGSAAITSRLDQPQRPSVPTHTQHASTDQRPADPAGDQSGPATAHPTPVRHQPPANTTEPPGGGSRAAKSPPTGGRHPAQAAGGPASGKTDAQGTGGRGAPGQGTSHPTPPPAPSGGNTTAAPTGKVPAAPPQGGGRPG